MNRFGNYNVYRKFRPLKLALRIISVTLVLILLLSAAVFFGFRKYIVYTEDSLYLDIPWLREESAETPVPSPSSAPSPSPAPSPGK